LKILKSVLTGKTGFKLLIKPTSLQLQLTWAAIQVGSSGTDAAMPCKRFQNVYGSAFVASVVKNVQRPL
jgi:hypothetical protein